MNLLKVISRRFETALTALGVDPSPYLDMIRPSQDPKFGDYQANFAMPLGKKLGKNPREVAAEALTHFQFDDLLEPRKLPVPGLLT